MSGFFPDFPARAAAGHRLAYLSFTPAETVPRGSARADFFGAACAGMATAPKGTDAPPPRPVASPQPDG
jgi:hypothetical protein